MRYFKIVLIAIVFLSCGKSEAIENIEKSSKKVLKVLSYNIRHGAPANSSIINMNDIAAVIKMQNPDIVALQELDKNTKRYPDDQAKVLAEKLNMHYFFSKSINYSGGEYGVGILSKYPILNQESILLPNEVKGGEQRSLALVTIAVPGLGQLKFASAHLDLVLQNRIAQIEQVNLLAKNSACPLIMAGDLNLAMDAEELSLLKKEFTLSCSANCQNTFPSDKPNKKIDFILLNPNATKKLKVRSYEAIGGRLESDHLPLLGIYSF